MGMGGMNMGNVPGEPPASIPAKPEAPVRRSKTTSPPADELALLFSAEDAAFLFKS